jgi:diguanylate cyclase (GGDEF)-like protein
LRLGVVACRGSGVSALAPHLNARLIESLQALELLQMVLPQMADRCEQLESRAIDTEAALATAQAELAGTQDDERRARHEATHDALTSLPNGRCFRERLEGVVARSLAAHHGLAVLYLDLDGFKSVNDLHGHEVGDELLKIIATRMSRHVRSEDMVSRLGGDEFACLRQGEGDRAQLERWAEKLYQLISAPMKIGSLDLAVPASIGIAIYPEDGTTASELLRNSDAAMYRAKRACRKMDFYSYEK